MKIDLVKARATRLEFETFTQLESTTVKRLEELFELPQEDWPTSPICATVYRLSKSPHSGVALVHSYNDKEFRITVTYSTTRRMHDAYRERQKVQRLPTIDDLFKALSDSSSRPMKKAVGG